MSGCWLLMRRYCCIMGVCLRAASFMDARRLPQELRRVCRGGRSRVGSRWVSLFHMVSDPELYELAARVAHKLRAAQRRLVTAESCTGGWVAKALTDVPGSSEWFECGYVTYSNAAKMRDLGVAGG